MREHLRANRAFEKEMKLNKLVERLHRIYMIVCLSLGALDIAFFAANFWLDWVSDKGAPILWLLCIGVLYFVASLITLLIYLSEHVYRLSVVNLKGLIGASPATVFIAEKRGEQYFSAEVAEFDFPSDRGELVEQVTAASVYDSCEVILPIRCNISARSFRLAFLLRYRFDPETLLAFWNEFREYRTPLKIAVGRANLEMRTLLRETDEKSAWGILPPLDLDKATALGYEVAKRFMACTDRPKWLQTLSFHGAVEFFPDTAHDSSGPCVVDNKTMFQKE